MLSSRKRSNGEEPCSCLEYALSVRLTPSGLRGRFAILCRLAYIRSRSRVAVELSELARINTTRIEPGDRLLVELPVVASWPDMGKVTVTIAETRFTFSEDNPEIKDVLKKAKEKAERG